MNIIIPQEMEQHMKEEEEHFHVFRTAIEESHHVQSAPEYLDSIANRMRRAKSVMAPTR